MTRTSRSCRSPRALVFGAALLALPLGALAQETSTLPAATTHDGQSRDDPPTDPYATPTSDLDDSDATADGVTYDNWLFLTPDRGSSDYVRFDVYRAVIRGHGQAEDANVSSATTVAGDAWGQDLVSVTALPGSAEPEFVEVVNTVEVIQSWSVDSGDGNLIKAHAYAIDIHNNRHHWVLNVRTDGSKSQLETSGGSQTVVYQTGTQIGAGASAGGGFVGDTFVPTSAEAAAEGSSHHGSTVAVDLSGGVVDSREAGEGEAGTFSDGFSTTIRTSGGWSGRIASEENVTLIAHAIINGPPTIVLLDTFDTINRVEGLAHYRICGPRTPGGEGDGDDGPPTPGGDGGEGDGPTTPGDDGGGVETPGGDGDTTPDGDEPETGGAPLPPTSTGGDDDAPPSPELEDESDEEEAPPPAEADGPQFEDPPAESDDADTDSPPSPAPTGDGTETTGEDPGGDVTPPGADDGTAGTDALGGTPNTGTGIE